MIGCSAGLVANTSYSIELLHKRGPHSIVRCAAIGNSDANLNQERDDKGEIALHESVSTRLDSTSYDRELSYSSETKLHQ